ncbi:uncharacterized protein N7484_001284 [Penicillium longicatenatum]|uniref:uncharacterized protein n=1 Tax=Penicillium longicatenatum TaxID=1561947 RepID=UPI002546ED4D|nr:uncharacterized protein N7484_001284 [Penicillium longicatenatum]KAJ5657635.1 hypothetical protein N7484_001284 [Penicillium longicatenatum]
MAEIIGTASAIVGLTTFVAQVVKKIDALKDAYKYNRTQAPVVIRSLISNLEIFHSILQSTQSLEGHPAVDQVILKCQITYESIDHSLEDLLKTSAKSTGLKLEIQMFSRNVQLEVEEIESKLGFMIAFLNL